MYECEKAIQDVVLTLTRSYFCEIAKPLNAYQPYSQKVIGFKTISLDSVDEVVAQVIKNICKQHVAEDIKTGRVGRGRKPVTVSTSLGQKLKIRR